MRLYIARFELLKRLDFFGTFFWGGSERGVVKKCFNIFKFCGTMGHTFYSPSASKIPRVLYMVLITNA